MNYIVSNAGVITVYVNGKPAPYEFAPDHPEYEAAKLALREKDADKIEELASVSARIEAFVSSGVPAGDGKAELIGGVVYFRGKPLHNTLTERIVALYEQGFPFEPMLRFVENLYQNPSKGSVDELYDFLSHKALPITEDGHFLAYKRVSEDWKDLHTGTIDNSIGQEPFMERNQVDDDRRKDCSNGLHVGAIEYVRGFSSGGHVIIVKVNPRDVVSVPESDTTKMRVCRYLVLEEYKGDLERILYTADGQEATPPAPTPARQDALAKSGVASKRQPTSWMDVEDDEDDDDYEDDDDCDEDLDDDDCDEDLDDDDCDEDLDDDDC